MSFFQVEKDLLLGSMYTNEITRPAQDYFFSSFSNLKNQVTEFLNGTFYMTLDILFLHLMLAMTW